MYLTVGIGSAMIATGRFDPFASFAMALQSLFAFHAAAVYGLDSWIKLKIGQKMEKKTDDEA